MYEQYKFKKQFFITTQCEVGARSFSECCGWKIETIAHLTVRCEPSLDVSRAAYQDSELLLLGTILDPDEPTASNASITIALSQASGDFESLEKMLARMAGRWVLVARIAESIFLYHDAGGLKTVFRYQDPLTQEIFIASQPELLADILKLSRHGDRDELVQSCGEGQWPPYLYPYDDIRQLLPNHRLSLTSYEMERYWPTGDIAQMSLGSAATIIERDIENTVRATMARCQCAFALTGGYDSRLLACCAESFKDELDVFSFHYRNIPQHDVILPAKVARILGLRYRLIKGGGHDNRLLDILSKNSSYMCLDSSRKEAENLSRVIGDGAYLQGLVGEQLRGFYRNGSGPEKIDAGSLAKIMRFKDNAFFRQGFSDWINGLPESNIDVLDLLYWECRIGIWAAACVTVKEAVVEILPPMNSRRLLEAGLGVDLEHRIYPYNLVRRIISKRHPKLVGIEFNTTPGERFKNRLSQTLPLPWRIKRRLRLV